VKCPECDEKLIDYLYQELSPEEKSEMDGHLESCDHCAKKLSQFQLVRTSFHQLKKHTPRSLTHQKILAHAGDMAFQQKRSWLTQLLLKPSAATIMVVLLAIGVFYYGQYYTPLRTQPENMNAESERVPATPSVGSEEELVAHARRPFVAMSSGIHQEQPEVLVRTAEIQDEGDERAREFLKQSKDTLYAFELGNFYFSQGEFEKAVTTYSMALMMNPQDNYADIIRYQLAVSYKKLDDCNSALKVLDDIQQSHPQHPEIDKVMIMAGDCNLDLKAYDKAEDNYTNFISKFPERKSLVADKLETAKKFRRANLTY